MAEHHPDAILLDLRMPVLDGIGAIHAADRRAPRGRDRRAHHIRGRQLGPGRAPAGARSYATKDADYTEIARALHAAVGGLTVFDPRVHATLLAATEAPPQPEPARSAPPPHGLTQRVAEVLGRIAHGMTNPEIAERLFLSNHTVKTHISRIFAKTGSRDRAAAIGYAHRHNIG